MKGIVLITILACAYAGSQLTATVGESCDKSSNYQVQSFTVTPWPIIRTQQYTILMTGVFVSKEYVEQLYFATRLNRGFWHYTYQTIEKEYPKNTQANFTISIQAPAEKGAYTDQVTLHHHDFSSLACWQYDYDL